jgi:hypothetical protein
MTSKESTPFDIKDWLLNQGPKFKDGLPLPVRVKTSKSTVMQTDLPATSYRGIAKALSNSDIDVDPDRF